MDSIQRKNIVYIEDRLEDIQLFKRIIKKEFSDSNFISFDDSEKVRHLIENNEFEKIRPDLIFIDLKMPKISGLELLGDLNKQEFRRIPKIMFSSSTINSDIEHAYNLGANSYVEKPKSFQSLKYTVVSAVKYWVEINLS
ncbi:two-component system response regulator [Nonlabens tegetincola]|uniref:Two-component system response regulator n=1 Tax=Nonlabens tegetincola TaxID=323273 RepID=A0A090Q0T0_9FLAO|nr:MULTISPECIES: response regulator [Nonlabens]GAK95787.1 two-component system response regulator [Nonlabens tegetincola]